MNGWQEFLGAVLLHLWRGVLIYVALFATNQIEGGRGERFVGALFGGIILAPMIAVWGTGAEGEFGSFTLAVYLAMLLGSASPRGRILWSRKDDE